jgi:TPR repeat protein
MLYAAENGVAAAQFDVGMLYKLGAGTDHNAFEAAKWLRKAALAGHTEAEFEYAIALFMGRGTPPDEQQAAALLLRAAQKGWPPAQNRLARAYAHGLGVEMNLLEAAKWQVLARSAGMEDATLEAMLAKLSRADRAKAEAAAEQWREQSLLQ